MSNSLSSVSLADIRVSSDTPAVIAAIEVITSAIELESFTTFVETDAGGDKVIRSGDWPQPKEPFDYARVGKETADANLATLAKSVISIDMHREMPDGTLEHVGMVTNTAEGPKVVIFDKPEVADKSRFKQYLRSCYKQESINTAGIDLMLSNNKIVVISNGSKPAGKPASAADLMGSL